MHTSVLLKEAIEGLEIKKNGLYIDGTYGEGGHTKAILQLGAKVLAFEWDKTKLIKLENQNLTVVFENFANIEKVAKGFNFVPVDGVLLDLGLSMEQIAVGKRGFSFKADNEVLDMRISSDLETKASDIVNSFSANELYEVFSKNSEEISSRSIADLIVRSRSLKKIETVADLKNILGKDESRLRRIFQALRIEVNGEFENLQIGLVGALNILKTGGVIAVITFHSLEDRIVKKFIEKNGLKEKTKKPIMAKNNNKFEKTAKLRLIIK